MPPPPRTGLALDRSRLAAKKTFTFSRDGSISWLLMIGANLLLMNAQARRSGVAIVVAGLIGAMPLLGFTIAGLRSRIRVGVGVDGLRIRQSTGDRFVSYADVERLEAVGGLFEGGPIGVRFKIRGGAEETWAGAWGRTAFLETVRQAMAEHQRRAEERRAQGLPTGVRVVTTSAGIDYRGSAYPTDMLVRVAEDPTEHLGTRLAATQALRGRGDLQEEHARIRVAAEETASEALRGELEALAEHAAPRHATRP